MRQVFTCIVLLMCVSCTYEKRRIVTDIVTEWKGKEIVFPKQWTPINYVDGSLMKFDFGYYEYSIVNYIDSSGCVSCKLGLRKWTEWIPCLDSAKVACVFVFNPKKNEVDSLKRYLKYNNFSYPVFIDEQDIFNSLNHFPSDEQFHTFLLDHKNRVLAIGNPVYSTRIYDLYKKIVLSESGFDDEEN